MLAALFLLAFIEFTDSQVENYALCHIGSHLGVSTQLCLKEMYLGTLGEAKDYCIIRKNGSLPTIERSLDNQQMGFDTFTTTCDATDATPPNWNADVILGLQNGMWLSNRDALNYTNYATGEQDKNGSTVLRRDAKHSFKWYREVDPATIVCTWQPSLQCLYGYFKVDQLNICIQASNISSQYYLANVRCQHYGKDGSVAVVSDWMKNEFFYNLGKSASLASSKFGDYIWLGLSWNSTTWGNGDPITWTNFYGNQSISSDPHLCLAMSLSGPSASKWIYRECENDASSFFCQFDASTK